jgi:uncharacterized coiled-coil DUF342 family protein
MDKTLKSQIAELHQIREEKLTRVRELGEKIRDLAKNIVDVKRSFGLRKEDEPRELRKRIRELEFKISTENLPLPVEKEFAKKIKVLEDRVKKIEEIEKRKSSISKIENEIKTLKEERDKLKGGLDLDRSEIGELKKDLKTVADRQSGYIEEVSLAEIATMKKNRKG